MMTPETDWTVQHYKGNLPSWWIKIICMSNVSLNDGLTYLQIRKPQSILRIHAVYMELKYCACRFLRVHTLSVQTAMALIRLHRCAG